MGIDSICSKLLKKWWGSIAFVASCSRQSVLAVRLDLAKLRLKTTSCTPWFDQTTIEKLERKIVFCLKSESLFLEQNHFFFTSKFTFLPAIKKLNVKLRNVISRWARCLISNRLTFKTWKFYIFSIFRKNRWCTPLQKMEEKWKPYKKWKNLSKNESPPYKKWKNLSKNKTLQKNMMSPLTKNAKCGQKINFLKKDRDR